MELEEWRHYIEVRVYPLACILVQEAATFGSVFLIFLLFLVISWLVPPFDEIWDHIKRNHKPGQKLKAKMFSDSELDKPAADPTNAPSSGSSSSRRTANELKSVPSDLHKYRKRIDNSVLAQRSHREILQSLQDKVMKYRQKAAEAEAQAASASGGLGGLSHGVSYPSLFSDGGQGDQYLTHHQSVAFPSTSNVDQHFSQSTPGIPSLSVRYSDTHNYTAADKTRKSIRFAESLDQLHSHIHNNNTDSTADIYRRQLQEEQYRNNLLEDMVDTLKHQAESFSHKNEHLTSDLMRIHTDLAKSEQDRMMIREMAKQREQKLKHEQKALQQQFFDLSMEINRLKRKINEFKSDTTSDLDNYKSEYERTTRSIENRIKHQETMRFTMKEKSSKETDAALEEVMKRYDEAVSKGLASEHEKNEMSRKVIFLESALKRAQDERERVEDALKKIHQLPEVAEALGRRTRSVSPVHTSSLGHEAMRNIRLALHSKMDEIDNQKKEMTRIREKEAEMEAKFDKMEKEKRQTERSLKEEKAAKEDVEHDKEALEKQIARLQERLEKSEEEKTGLNNTVLKLNEQMAESKVTYQQNLDDLRIKTQQEWDVQFKRMQEEHEQLEENLNQRIVRARNEAESLRSDISKQRDSYHELQNELISERRKTVEKETENNELSKKFDALHMEIANSQVQFQQREVSIVQLEKQNSDLEHKEKVMTEKVEELEEEKATLTAENNALTGELNELRAQVEEMSVKCESLEESEARSYDQVEKYKEMNKEVEKKNHQIRTAIIDLELKLEETSDKCRALERDLAEEKTEVAKNIAIISRMNKDRAEITNIKETLEAELESLKRELVAEVNRRETGDKLVIELEAKLAEAEDTGERLEAAKQTLTLRVKELNSQVAELKETTTKSEQIVAEHKELIRTELEKNREEADNLVRALKTEHSMSLEREETEKTELRNEINGLKDKIDRLNEVYSQTLDEHKLLGEQFDVYRSDQTEAVNRMKAELLQASDNARQDLLDNNELRLKDKHELENKVKKLEKDLEDAEEDIKEGLLREAEAKSRIEILESRLSQGADMVLKLKAQLEELGDRSNELSAQAESEREQLKSQIDQLNGSLSWTRQEKEETLRKMAELDKTLQVNDVKSQKHLARLKEADEELGAANSKIRDLEQAASELKFRIRDVESQLGEVSDQRDKLKALNKQLENRNHELAGEQTTLRSQMAVVEAKLKESDHRYETRLSEMKKLNVERRSLELSFTDKSTELVSLNTLIKQYEQHQAGYIKEIAEEKEKTLQLEQEVAALKAENKSCKEELTHAVSQIEKKTATNQAVIGDLLDNYRHAEKEKLMALREIEENKAEIEILRHRLELNENKRKELDQILDQNESEKTDLRDRLNYYERSAKKALSFAKTHASSSTRTQSQGPKVSRYQQLDLDEALFGSPRMGKPTSIPDLSQFDAFDRPQLPVSSSNLDISNSMELTFKILKDKIAELESEKSELLQLLRKNRSENEDVVSSLREQKTKFSELQRFTNELQEAKSSLEHKLVSSRQVLLAQEESIRAKEQDKKTFKAKIISADMHSRDKEARIHALTNEITSLKLEIQNLEDDKKKLKDAEVHWEKERREIESVLRETRMEMDRLQSERLVLVKEKETMTHRLKESEQTTFVAQQKCQELERTIDRRQQSLARLQQDESQWKNKVDSMRRSATDVQQLELRIESLKIELETMTQKYKNSEGDREQIRRELIDVKSRLNSSTLKVNDLNMAMVELLSEKKRCIDRIEILERFEKDTTSVERDIRRELEQIKSERIGMMAEIEDLKRQLYKVEVNKKEFEAQIQRLERERAALKRHVEAVELDKQRIESAIRQTSLERHALDKSLSAMEKENSELYRNCSQLQSQLNHLERESSNRVTEVNNKKRMQFEAEIHKLNQEKRQLEKLIEQREQNYLQKYKVFESQLSMVREQLDAERRKRRDLMANQAAGSIASSVGRKPGSFSMKPPFRI